VVASYVLSNFEREELEILRNEVFGKIYERIIKMELTPESLGN
jgi:hypothetical protein